MKVAAYVFLALAAFCSASDDSKPDAQLKVEVLSVPEECQVKSKIGDMLTMHYTGKLQDGTTFDSRLGLHLSGLPAGFRTFSRMSSCKINVAFMGCYLAFDCTSGIPQAFRTHVVCKKNGVEC